MVITLRVLFVEDSESDAVLIIHYLGMAGYIVDYERVETSDKMRAALQKHSWDLIFSDYKLSHFDAAEALTICHELSPDIPFIVIANELSDAQSIVNSIKAGAHDYLTKNNLKRLIPAVVRELNEAKIRSEKRLTNLYIEQRKKYYQSFFKHDISGNYLSTPDGQLIDLNPAFAKLLGYESSADLSEINIRDLFADPTEFNTIIARLKKERNIESIEHELIRKDGQRIVCVENIIGIIDKEGELNHFLGYIINITEQKHAETVLKESESRYRTLFSEMMEGFALHEIICDKEGKPVDYRFLSVNPAFERMTGLSVINLIDKTVLEVIPDIEASWIKKYGKVALTSIPITFEDYVRALDKFYRVVAFCPKKGQFATIITDITESKKAEELFHQSKNRLIRGEYVFKSGNWELHLESGIITASEGARKLYGIEGEKWDFEIVKKIPLPEYRALLDNALSLLINDGIPYDIEFKIRQIESGQVIDIHSIAEYDSHRGIIFGVIKDITERKRTEDALKESEERYRSLFEGSPDSIFLADSETGLIMDVNKAASRLTGWSREDMIGKYHDQLHSPLFRTEMQNNFKKLTNNTREKENLLMSESYILNSDESETPVEILASLFAMNGKQVVQGIFRDITTRKNTEKELINREKKYRELANSLPVSVYETDLKGNIIFANATTFEWFGYTEPEVNNEFNIAQFILESQRPLAYERFRQLLIKDLHTTVEYTAKRKDGSLFPVLISSFAVKKDDIATGVRCTVVDLSELKQTHSKLKTSERTFTNLIRNLPGFVYRCRNDIDWTMEYLSEGFTPITGYSVDDILKFKNLTYNDIIHPDYRNYLWERWQVMLELKTPLEEEYTIITKDGEIRWVWERGRGIYNDDGSLLYLEGFITDITVRKRAEQIQKVLYDISTAVITTQNLEELIEIIRNQLGTLLDTSNFYVAFYDEVSGMLYTPHAVDQKDNLESWPAEKSMTGYLIKQKKALLVSAEDVLKLVERGEIQIVGTPSKLWLGVPLYEDKKIIGAFVVQSYDNPNAYTLKDVEMFEFISHQISLFVQRKRAEEELRAALAKAEESDRLKSAFLATMNHELRTPLNHILGFSELITSGVMPEDNQNFASSIYSSGKNLLAIVEDVFDLALAEQANVKVRLQTFRLMDQFMENKSSFDHILQSSGKAELIQLIFKPDTRLLSMYLTVDRSKVNQILINLFKNAVKFTNTGTIEFGYQSNETGRLTFFIKDTGIGIPKDKQSVIFDFFRQGDDSRTRVHGGIGIGLAIAQRIAKILKGELSVISEPDKGSAFYLTVPVELTDINDPS